MAPRSSLALALVAFAATASADWTGLLGLEFESDVPVERRGMHCPSGYITGMEVKHGRRGETRRALRTVRLSLVRAG